MDEMMKVLRNQLGCTRCSFHGSDYKNTQIHMGTIHPEFCEEINAGGLGRLVFYQKSARLFHCKVCFFTSKMFANVYYHCLSQHQMHDQWSMVSEHLVDIKSEPTSDIDSDKNDSESLEGEDDKSVGECNKSNTVHVKTEENDTLTSWPEKAPSRDNPDNSDSDFKSSSIEKVSDRSAETKDKESSSDPELSESSNNSTNLRKPSPLEAKVGTEFSDNDGASSPSKDIPEFSDDDDYEPALPGGIPHFSEDEETAPQTKEVDSLSEDEPLPDQSRGIEDISEDEMPPEEKPIDNMSEDEAAPAQSKEQENSSEEEENASAIEKEMECSEEEDVPPLRKGSMEYSEEEEEEESTIIPKNAMDLSDEEETANATKNIMEYSEDEETTNVSKHVMEVSEDGTSGLSKDIMDFSAEEDEDTPAVSKGIMEYSDEEDLYSPSKDMPKYLECSLTPTQSKDYTDDIHASSLKGSSPFSEDDEIPDEGTSDNKKDFAGTSANYNVPARLPGVARFTEYKATPWSKDRLETINTGDISLTVHDTHDESDDKDGYVKDEEILKHVKRVKGRFHCLLCDCRPLKRGPILHHLITRHNIPSPFICKTCGKTFVMETHLKNHLSSHTKGLYKCQRCSFQTDHPRGFKKHQTHCENRHKEESAKPVSDFSDVQEEGHGHDDVHDEGEDVHEDDDDDYDVDEDVNEEESNEED